MGEWGPLGSVKKPLPAPGKQAQPKAYRDKGAKRGKHSVRLDMRELLQALRKHHPDDAQQKQRQNLPHHNKGTAAQRGRQARGQREH